MKKSLEDFVRWTKLKIRVHLSEPKIYFKEREIWWACLVSNIGFEQDGKHETFERPVLILKIFNLDILWVLPLTSKDRVGKYYFQIEHGDKKYSVILSQLRLVSSKRLLRKIRKISPEEFIKIKSKIKNLI